MFQKVSLMIFSWILATTPFITLTEKQSFVDSRHFIALKMLKIICSSFTFIINSLAATSIKVHQVARKGQPRINDTSTSSSMSNTIKFAGKMNLSTFTKMFSFYSLRKMVDLSASCNFMVVGFTSLIPNLLQFLYLKSWILLKKGW